MPASQRGFERAVAVRLGVAFACIALAAWLFGSGRYWVLPAVLIAVAIAQAASLVRRVRSSNQRIAAALASWRSRDLSGTGPDALDDTSFPELAGALDAVRRKLHADRADAEVELHRLQALVGHVPVPLVMLERSSAGAAPARVELVNHAARQLLGPAIATVDDLAALGPTLVRDVLDTPAGERRMARIVVAGSTRWLLITAGTLRVHGSERRLLALESIESELEARTLAAWVEMARVLAHEIMSSLTPIASLSATAAARLGELEAGAPGDPRSELLAEARLATETAARRSERLMTFVQRYRELVQLPAPQLAPLDAVELVHGVAQLLRGELRAQGTALTVEAPGSAIVVRGDRGLLEQALINLVRNAADAVRDRPDAQVWLRATVTVHDRVAIEVADNGPGVPAAMADKVFVPFFTTKQTGSGIGLTVAQHVAHAHHATLQHAERSGGGAVFSLVL